MQSDNRLSLEARIKHAEPLRYTPAGLPVLVLHLQHESWQIELGERYLAKVEIEAKLMGPRAEAWQHKQGCRVAIDGFLSHKGRRYPKPIVHIQNIYEI